MSTDAKRHIILKWLLTTIWMGLVACGVTLMIIDAKRMMAPKPADAPLQKESEPDQFQHVAIQETPQEEAARRLPLLEADYGVEETRRVQLQIDYDDAVLLGLLSPEEEFSIGFNLQHSDYMLNNHPGDDGESGVSFHVAMANNAFTNGFFLLSVRNIDRAYPKLDLAISELDNAEEDLELALQ